MKRKKRLIKGIESIEEQIKLHKEKQKAIIKRNPELADYYEREIIAKEKDKERMEELLRKQ